MRISDWSSDVCSSDLRTQEALLVTKKLIERGERSAGLTNNGSETDPVEALVKKKRFRSVKNGFTAILSAGRNWLDQLPLWLRSEEHTSELQSLMRNSYAVLCLKKKQMIK